MNLLKKLKEAYETITAPKCIRNFGYEAVKYYHGVQVPEFIARTGKSNSNFYREADTIFRFKPKNFPGYYTRQS